MLSAPVLRFQGFCLKGQYISIEAVQALVNITYSLTYSTPCIERADKAIHGVSEALANSMPQNHHWVNFVPC